MRKRGFSFAGEHEMFRDTVQRFARDVLAPGNAEWEKAGKIPREIWSQAGALGLLCPSMDADYGGGGGDLLFDVVLVEELAGMGLLGPLAGFMVHSNMGGAYIAAFGTEDQKRRWLPSMASGDAVVALGLTEPSAGSDLRGIQTRAKRDGDDYVISGQKVFISNGANCDLIVLAVKLDDTPPDALTLILVPANSPGFKRGRILEKIGMKAQDTCELFFDEVRVPKSNLLGEEGRGMRYLSSKLAEERLFQAIRSTAVAEAAIQWTVDYTRERKAFGQTIADFQNTRFKLAELWADTVVTRSFVDSQIVAMLEGDLDDVEAAAAKLNACELHCRVVDECLQLHGGWGYVWETPIARAYADARVYKIAGGSVEIMKMIISRSLFGPENRTGRST